MTALCKAARTQNRNLMIPDRYRLPITQHVIRAVANRPGPSILLLFGAPGEGKTSAIGGVLKALNVVSFPIDAGLLESPEAGVPLRVIRSRYRKAAAVMLGKHDKHCPDNRPRAAALEIHDVDLGLGQLATTQYTCNRQHLLAFFQGLCDKPERHAKRVPIFMTANDPSVLPESLIRSGRAEVLAWRLSTQERTDMVSRIFPKLAQWDVKHLVGKFPGQPISFFADLNRLWVDSFCRQKIARVGAKKVLQSALEGRWQLTVPAPTLNRLLDIGKEALTNRGDHQEDGYGD